MKPYVFRDEAPAIDILNPALPQPWIHYLSNGQMHAFTSQTGGGFAWWKDAVECRLTRYRMFHLPIDRPGYYLYVAEKGKETFCPTYQPVGGAVEDYRASFLPGKAVYRCRKNGLQVTQELFITPDENLLVWDVTLTNTTGEDRELDLTGYTELAQMKWVNEQLYGYYWRHMLKTWREQNLLCYLYQFREGTDYLNAPLVFFGSSEDVHSFSTDRNAFMGNYRDESNPQAIENHCCGNETMLSGEPCFALQVRKTVKAGQTVRVCWFLGVSEDGLVAYEQAVAKAQNMAASCRDFAWLDGQKQKLETSWDRYLDHTKCVLPDKDLQRMISTWAPINCMTTARFSRAINVEAPGVRGFGFRDSTQDMIAMCPREPEMAKNMFRKLLSKQYAAGKAVHMFPLNPHELPQFETRCDSHLWLPMLLYGILADTGDYSLLEEKVPYLSEDDHRSSQGEGTVWEHMMAAMHFTETHLGAHGLPLTLKGDWNDIIGKFSEKKKGESVFAANQYIIDLKLLAEIARLRNLPEAEKLEAMAAKQINAVETHAYNGKWWYRCFDDNGDSIGDEQSEFGKLWLNPQSWAVMSGAGTKEQNESAMGHVYETLKTQTGLRLIYPGFKTYPEVTDPFTGYNPGNGENGAIFCHANGWAVIAQALLGDGDKAWEYYTLLAPQKALERVGLQTYRAEPYAWASNIVGPENPKHGWANVTHITGTAAWMDIAANQFLLGIRPKLTGVQIAPVMKSDWKEMYAERVYRGTRICMKVCNPNGVTSGVAKITVDGAAFPESFIPADYLLGKETVAVEVTLG